MAARHARGELVPHVRGTAFVTGETTLHFDPRDPFRCGFGSE
jgi:proline racemase